MSIINRFVYSNNTEAKGTNLDFPINKSSADVTAITYPNIFTNVTDSINTNSWSLTMDGSTYNITLPTVEGSGYYIAQSLIGGINIALEGLGITAADTPKLVLKDLGYYLINSPTHDLTFSGTYNSKILLFGKGSDISLTGGGDSELLKSNVLLGASGITLSINNGNICVPPILSETDENATVLIM